MKSYEQINAFIKNKIGEGKEFPRQIDMAKFLNLPQTQATKLYNFLNKQADTSYKDVIEWFIKLGGTFEIENGSVATIQRMGANSPVEKIHNNDEGLLKIDIYQVTGAGNPFVLRENEPITSVFVSELYARQADIAFLVDGESMYPTIKNNAIVGVSLKKDFQPNEVFAINHPAGGVTIKRISIKGKNWVIRSDNPNKELYPQEDQYSLEEYPNLIIGRVVWVWQSM